MTAFSFLAGRKEVLLQMCSPQPSGNKALLLSTGREVKGLTLQYLPLQVLGPQVPSRRDKQLARLLQKAGHGCGQRYDTQYSCGYCISSLLYLLFYLHRF